MARTYSSMAYESANWVYVDLHFQTSDIIRNTPMASPIDTSVVSPWDVDSLNDRLALYQAALDQILPDELDNHDKDENQNENEGLLIACIIGSIALLVLIAAACVKYMAIKRVSNMNGEH